MNEFLRTVLPCCRVFVATFNSPKTRGSLFKLKIRRPFQRGFSHVRHANVGIKIRRAKPAMHFRQSFYSFGGFNTPTLCVVIKGMKPDCDIL